VILKRLSKVLMVLAVVGYVSQAPLWAAVDRSELKKGMSLPQVVQAFGLPASMEWVNFKGQAILVVFFESEDKGFFQGGPLGGDTVKREDGRTFLPLGFVTDQLTGWGKKFYLQITSPE
jgi:hypothetical protein